VVVIDRIFRNSKNKNLMRKIIVGMFLFILCQGIYAQKNNTYKKKVLDHTEIDFLYSNYAQSGDHAAITGGSGNEKAGDNAPAILINIPLNADDVLSIDYGVDLTTAASTSKINPFTTATINNGANTGNEGSFEGASINSNGLSKTSGTALATGASTSGGTIGNEGGSHRSKFIHARKHGVFSYEHSSNSRSFSWGLLGDFSTEVGYNSVGFGAQLRKSFNDENSEINISSKAYLDKISLIYPAEFRASLGLSPSVGFKQLSVTNRNSYSTSLSFSQVVSKRIQIALIGNFTIQEGLLSTNYQRVYFKDKPIVKYKNFELANDIERLPSTRKKYPLGIRLNYFLADFMVLRTFYRHYNDNWGLSSNTYDIQIPLILSPNLTIYPTYRYYQQQQSKYFAPKRVHLSTDLFYTSDYDLSTFNSSQYGVGIEIAPPFGIFSLDTSNAAKSVKLRSLNLRYGYYSRTDGLTSNIFSLIVKFTF